MGPVGDFLEKKTNLSRILVGRPGIQEHMKTNPNHLVAREKIVYPGSQADH